MSDAKMERRLAAQMPEGDVVGILLEQHARIRDLFADVKGAEGDHKQQAFDELRALLAVHETAEEMIVRPVARETAGKQEADARNHEEEEANKVLASLEKMDVTSAEFDTRLAEFERAVVDHAEHEENEEFPAVHEGRTEDQLRRMGTMLRAAEKIAPTHPHPSAAGSPAAQWSVGPFASLVDRTRDAINAAMPSR
ncbi:hemerythrin domain-containing protein [Streptomyces sp. NBS 14/10]|uniref:hemerythrin domain-containing protein n=1 Tax=Streptomyces sp. NBS 14/10 TaxID=1945643 RepID=UPI000B7D2850|nr:hemerythrin domain-containing protein [Streptomyces sp. NBS 14/10]KAK1185699.1 hemerythrin domain-containing protein [Streptomyces sp. NBS 14/10]NUS86654.1 hemerythrin domain-containing protein [Streptomyces sp.]